jgi:hypothetical protein
VQPATLGAGSLVKAATQSIVAVRRARPARPLDLAGPRVPLALVHSQAARLDAARAPSGGQFSAVEVRGANDAAGRSPAGAPLALHWQTSPEIVRVARQIRHNGLPIVRLWQSGQNLVAIGLNPHGVPGIYFTQKVPD